MWFMFEKIIGKDKEDLKGFGIVDTASGKVSIYSLKDLFKYTLGVENYKELLRKQPNFKCKVKMPNRQEIENLFLVAREEKVTFVGGETGVLSRYPSITASKDLYVDKKCKAMTVLSRISSEEYKVITAPGKLYRIKKDKLITYAERYGLTNAKLVNRETGVVISLLSGNIYQEPVEELVVEGQNSKLQKQEKEKEQEQTTKRNKETVNSIKEKNEEKIKKPNENENNKGKEDKRLVTTKTGTETETATPTITVAVPETVESEKEVEKETELEKLMKVIQFLKATYNKREQSSLVTLDSIGKVCIDNNIHSMRDIKKDELDSILDEIKMYADTNFSIEEWESASLFG